MRPIRGVLGFLFVVTLLLGPAAASTSSDKRLIKIGSDITVEKGEKIRSVWTIGGQITVHGTVEKSAVAVGGSVVLTKTAVVKGNVVSLGGVIVMSRDAEVGGDLTEINSSNIYETMANAVSREWDGWSWVFAMISLSIFFAIMVLALLIAALLPKPVRVVSEAVRENTFKVILCGILGLVLIAPLALLLTISVVGIALIPLEIIIVVCSVLLGFIAVGQMIGATTLRLFKRPHPGIVSETFWGLIILWLIGWIPYIGWMIKAIAIVIGLGAVLVSRFGTYQGWKCPPPVAGTDMAGGLTSPPAPPAPPPAPSDSRTTGTESP